MPAMARFLSVAALCLGTAWAAELCEPALQQESAHGEALLQAKGLRKTSVAVGMHQPLSQSSLRPLGSSAPNADYLQKDAEVAAHDLAREAECYSGNGYQGAPKCVAQEVEVDHRHRIGLVAMLANTATVGKAAPLDAAGFKATTSLCCPMETEEFFNRLLDSLGLIVCSKPHIQGLMHWFTCVPDMDFQYVLDIIANGNPCKYWAPKGETCPALSAECEGRYCSSPPSPPPSPPSPEPTTTAAPEPTPPPIECDDSDAAQFDFFTATMSNSNLGGFDDTKPANLRFDDLASGIDLVITNVTTYVASSASSNGKNGKFGRINVQQGSTTRLLFEFLDHDTQTPKVLPEFYFSFLDIDNFLDGANKETIAVDGFDSWIADPTHELVLSTSSNGGLSATSTKVGWGCDNPTDPEALGPITCCDQLPMFNGEPCENFCDDKDCSMNQRSRTVMFIFKGKSRFFADFAVGGDVDENQGRYSLFAGKSSLIDLCATA